MIRLLCIAMLLWTALGAAHAQAAGLCTDKEFIEKTTLKVKIGWDKPDPLDPNPEPIVPNPNLQELLITLRTLESGWQTPSEFWPQSSVSVEFLEHGVMTCQAIYAKRRIYVMNENLSGFVTRPIDANDFYALNIALGLYQD